MKLVLKIAGGVSLAIVVLVAAGCGSTPSDTSASADNSAAKVPDVSLLNRQSYAFDEGITDYYTGDGRVDFNVKLRNNTDSEHDFWFTPVIKYDDGEENNSVGNYGSCTVPAGETMTCTDTIKYEAHAHSIVETAVDVDGTEYSIPLSS
jgi:hypothetical protein